MGQAEDNASSRDRALAAVAAVSALMARRRKPGTGTGSQVGLDAAPQAVATSEAGDRALAAAIAVSVLLARGRPPGQARRGQHLP